MRLRTDCRWKAALLGTALVLVLPAVARAAEGSESGWGEPWVGIGRFVNLLLVVAVLVWIARRPLASFYVSRSKAIHDQLAEAEKARLDAELQLAEITARMSSLDDELAEIKAAAEQEAREEKQRLIADAERDAEKIVERARREIDGMTRAAQLELKAHAAQLAVELATEKIRSEITDEDRSRLFARFVATLGGRK